MCTAMLLPSQEKTPTCPTWCGVHWPVLVSLWPLAQPAGSAVQHESVAIRRYGGTPKPMEQT